VVAAKVTEFLKATDRFAKTIIFCENIEHAERMRQAMVNANPDLAAANDKYVVRITGDNTQARPSSTTSSTPRRPIPSSPPPPSSCPRAWMRRPASSSCWTSASAP
jgi:type I restriction enzyme R subunit